MKIIEEPGVYKITNKVTGKIYIGSSKNILRRILTHIYFLERGQHGNRYLQASFNKHGKDNFQFEAIEACPEEEIIMAEQRFLDELEPFVHNGRGYNVCSVAKSGPLFTDHPEERQEEIRAKMRLNTKGHKFEKGYQHSEKQQASISSKLREQANQRRIEEVEKFIKIPVLIEMYQDWEGSGKKRGGLKKKLMDMGADMDQYYWIKRYLWSLNKSL